MRRQIKDKLKFIVLNLEAGDLLEHFFIATVATTLLVRAFLYITDYPKIGWGNFHIAHMLWGGLLMFIAITLLLVSLNKEAKKAAAVIGGIGFGLFIDEIGKFLTKDNNYHYQPTIALIYVILVLIFLGFRSLEKYIETSDKDFAINAVELLKDAFMYDLSSEEKARVKKLLKLSKSKGVLVEAAEKILSVVEVQAPEEPSIFTLYKSKLHEIYLKLINTEWFVLLIIMAFSAFSILSLIQSIFNLRSINSFIELGQVLSSILSGTLVSSGIFYLVGKKRLHAFELFKKGILVSIFLTQFFLFYSEQLSAIQALLTSLLLLIVLQYLIEQEKVRQEQD